MRRFTRLLLVPAVALLASASAGAAPEPKPAPAGAARKPLLWRIEGGGLTTPSWLFGTLHLGGNDLTNLHPAAATAFASADVVCTEAPMDAANTARAAGNHLRVDGTTLSGSIGERLALELDTELKAIDPTLRLGPYEACKTWYLALQIPRLRSQRAGETMLDAVLWDRATTQGKQVAALESAKSQADLLDELKESDQIILLAETLRQRRQERARKEDSIAQLRAHYLGGDEQTLWEFFDKTMSDMGEHKELAARLIKRVVTDRNRSMAATIAGRLAAAPGKAHFFAVGAAHCVGPASIPLELEAKGYRVTRIHQ